MERIEKGESKDKGSYVFLSKFEEFRHDTVGDSY